MVESSWTTVAYVLVYGGHRQDSQLDMKPCVCTVYVYVGGLGST